MDTSAVVETLVQLAGIGLMGVATSILAKAQGILGETAETLAKFQSSVSDFRDEVRDLRAEVREMRDLNDGIQYAIVGQRTPQPAETH